MKDPNKNTLDMFIKPLALVGFLSILILASFTTISIANNAGKAFSYLASAAVTLSSVFKQAEPIILGVAPSNILSGEKTTVSWKRGGLELGSYSLFYPCLDGFRLELENGKAVSCDTPLNLENTDNKLVLKAISVKNRYVDMPITISFSPEGSSRVINSSGSIIVSNENPSPIAELPKTISTVSPTQTVPTNTTPVQTSVVTPISTTPTVQNTAAQTGKADLIVTIIEIGTVDKVTNQFTKSDTLKRSDRIGVRFAIENVGPKSSNEWRFNAVLPTFPPHTFNSDSQPVLKPGDRIEYTIGFDQSVEGDQSVNFVIDPQNFVDESREDNNTASVSMKIL